MPLEDEYFHTLTKEQLWQRYCGFLDLSIDEFMGIQQELLMDEIGRVTGSTLGRKIMGDQRPQSVEEFRQKVPLTTYDDYEPYLSERRDDTLAVEPLFWCHSSGRGGRFKWLPVNAEAIETCFRNFLATCVLASTNKKGQVNVAPGLRFLTVWPPAPYSSGSIAQVADQYLSCRVMPPLEIAKDMEFPERIKKGFQMALKDGVDIVAAISSVLAKMGEAFTEQTRGMQFTRSMLHPKIMFCLLRAWLRAKMQKRAILPKDLWSPKAIICSGVDTSIYKDEIRYYWGREPFDFYVSTETLFVATQAWNKRAMTFFPNSVFLEFVPHGEQLKQQGNKNHQPSTVLLNEVEEGKLYEVIISQFYGLPLLRYHLNDIIKVVSLKDEETGVSLPQIIIRGKVGETINLGSLASLDEKTIWQAIANTGIKYTDWSACKEYEQSQSFLRLYIELKEEREAAKVANMIDEQLKIVDTDYKDIDAYLRLKPVRVTLLSPGTFQRYMEEKRKEGADLAHLKPTHVNAPEAVIQRLLRLSETTTGE